MADFKNLLMVAAISLVLLGVDNEHASASVVNLNFTNYPGTYSQLPAEDTLTGTITDLPSSSGVELKLTATSPAGGSTFNVLSLNFSVYGAISGASVENGPGLTYYSAYNNGGHTNLYLGYNIPSFYSYPSNFVSSSAGTTSVINFSGINSSQFAADVGPGILAGANVYSGNGCCNFLVVTAPAPTPLPAALPMFGAALVGLGGLARRRAKKAA